MLGIILMIGAAWFGYKKAKLARRNPYLWGAIAFVTFFVPQFIFSVTAALIFSIGVERRWWDAALDEQKTSFIGICSLVVGFIGLLLVYRHLDKIPVEKAEIQLPPPPTFGHEN